MSILGYTRIDSDEGYIYCMVTTFIDILELLVDKLRDMHEK